MQLKTITGLLCCATIIVTAAGVIAHSQDREGSVENDDQVRLSQRQGPSSRNDKAREPGQMQPVDNAQNKTVSIAPFYEALEKALAGRARKLKDVCSLGEPVARRVLEDYGAMFVAAKVVEVPTVCVFQNEGEVIKFQNEARFTTAKIGGVTIELQPAAMEALVAARVEAQKEHLDITPRGGTKAARRSYADTLRLWNTRFLPALSYWTTKGRLSAKEAARLRQLPAAEQVREVLELEKRGIFFSKDLSKSILYSIAAPGTSQHTAMLALDVTQFANPRVRRILAAHGWFQTVKSDLPHFTFLGVDEKELPNLGLTRVTVNSQLFWVPNVRAAAMHGAAALLSELGDDAAIKISKVVPD